MTSILVCEWCSIEFERPNLRGPAPKYCSASHRQRAYEDKKLDDTFEILKKATGISDTISKTLTATSAAADFAKIAQRQTAKTQEMIDRIGSAGLDMNKITSSLSKHIDYMPKQKFFSEAIRPLNLATEILGENSKIISGTLSEILKTNSLPDSSAINNALAASKIVDNRFASNIYVEQIEGMQKAFAALDTSSDLARGLREASKAITGLPPETFGKMSIAFSQSLALSNDFADASAAFSSVIGSMQFSEIDFKTIDWIESEHSSQIKDELLPFVEKLIESSEEFIEDLTYNNIDESFVNELTKTGQEKAVEALAILLIFAWEIATNGPMLKAIKSNFEILIAINAIYSHYIPNSPKLVEHTLLIKSLFAALNNRKKDDP